MLALSKFVTKKLIHVFLMGNECRVSQLYRKTKTNEKMLWNTAGTAKLFKYNGEPNENNVSKGRLGKDKDEVI